MKGLRNYKPTKGDGRYYSYTKTVLAFDEVIQWIELAKKSKLIRPPKNIIKQLQNYRERCSKECNKKPFRWN